LLFSTLRAYWTQYAAAVIPRLLWTAFKFAQPFLINTTIKWVETGQSQYFQTTGYGLIAAYGLVYVGIALSQALYWQHTYRFIVMVRGGLISMIFQKTLMVNPIHKMRHDPIVLMGTDIEKIALSLRQVHEVWASTIEIAIALWLLEKQLEAAFVAPAVLTIGLSLYLWSMLHLADLYV
jgi:ATP-binding cassette subfamily C (CFTR/MRP) protein 1